MSTRSTMPKTTWDPQEQSQLQSPDSGCNFVCDQCGACCRHIPQLGELFSYFDNGHGVCRHNDAQTRLCTIYEERPMICHVKDGHDAFFADMPWDEYLAGVRRGCEFLKSLPDTTR